MPRSIGWGVTARSKWGGFFRLWREKHRPSIRWDCFSWAHSVTGYARNMNSLLKVVAFSGLAAAANAQAFNWTLEVPAVSPGVRERTATGTDGTLYYMYGGQNAAAFAGLDELWSYDGTTWSLLTASGASAGTRTGAVGGFDILRGKFVVFGGNNTNGVSGARDNDTWEWDATNGWVNVTPASGSPDGRWLVNNSVYIPGLGIVFHGGSAFDASGASYQSNETWAWTGFGWALLSSSGPATQNAMMEYRTAQGDLILHGGQNLLGETWSMDLGTGVWTQIVTATVPFNTSNPAEGLFAAMSYYNPLTGKVIVHGGNGGNSSTKTWEFDGTDWTDISTNGAACRNGGMHWIAALQKGVYGPCNESNGTRNRTRSHGPQTWGSFNLLGSDCPVLSSGLTASLSTSGMPAIGANLNINLNSLTVGNVPLILVGATLFGPLPLSALIPGSGASCSLQISPIVVDVAPSFSLAVPNNPIFVGQVLYAQSVQLETSGAANTQYAEITFDEL